MTPNQTAGHLTGHLTGQSADQLATQRKIVNRLRRANGQLEALITAVESGGDCRAVVTQLAAVSKAIDRATYLILATAMQRCLVEPDPAAAAAADAAGQPLSLEELERLFLMVS
ncbi:MAG: metal-sensitive transcriptional regulator [Propionibacteriaceae bacterium]|jgi:DNA-binding FrmR family transcriptional regulator|nr:metal-sensitive transcriptional regulator [Propionibacteriaceae bacterium]